MLDLSWNPLGSHGCRQIAEFAQVAELHLEGCGLSDAAGVEIATGMAKPEAARQMKMVSVGVIVSMNAGFGVGVGMRVSFE